MAEACYQPEYFRASYKGIAFDAMEVTSQHGRRGAEGEFPFGENTGYADLGRKIRTYSVRGRFATNDHLVRSAQLIAVCELPGPGPLVHPTRGIVTVACRSITVTDNPLEAQGVTYVDLDFVEANVWLNGFSLAAGLQTGLSLVALIAAAGGTFTANYKPRQAKPYNREKIQAAASGAILEIKDSYQSAAVKPEGTDPNTWPAILDLERRASDVAVLQDADETFRTIRLGMAALSSATLADGMYAAFLALANENANSSALTGIDQATENSIYAVMRILSAGYMARGALQQTNVNAQDAFRAYEQVSEILGQEIDAARDACDNNLYIELRNFYVSAQTALLNRVYTLPALVIYNFRKPVHSLVAAYEIYNDAKRIGDIENQNPGAVPWGTGPRVVASGS